MKMLNVDGERTVVENLGLLLRQLLPIDRHDSVGRLIGRLAMSLHVDKVLSAPWNVLTTDQRGEILREVALAVDAATTAAVQRGDGLGDQ